jgi:WD40 repeat protein
MDGTARTWDGQTGKALLVLEGHTGRVTQALWSPDGRTIATAGEDGTVRIWDARDSEVLRIIETNAGIVWSLAWSPDGLRLVTGHEDNSLRFWEATSGKMLETVRGHSGLIASMSWSPINQRLASTDGNGEVRIWNAAASTAQIPLPYQHAGGQMDITHDGRYLALPTGNPNAFMAPFKLLCLAYGIWRPERWS